jgi:protein-S-isoprenylcysteine O-methyltransferase Ste14
VDFLEDKNKVLAKAKGKAVRNIIFGIIYNVILFMMIKSITAGSSGSYESAMTVLIYSAVLFVMTLVFFLIWFWEKMGNFYVILKEEKIRKASLLGISSVCAFIPGLSIISVILALCFVI